MDELINDNDLVNKHPEEVKKNVVANDVGSKIIAISEHRLI